MRESAEPAPAGGRATARPALLVTTLLVAANLRVAVASVPPLLLDIRHALGLSLIEAALLTSAPLLCFGLLAPLGAAAVRRFGLRSALAIALVVLTLGLALRLGPSVPTLFAGTVLAGAGVAMANVLLPALVKDAFGARLGLATGLYTTAMGLAAALAAGLSAPLAGLSALGWRLGLGVWLVPCACALAAWLRVGAAAPALPPARAKTGGAGPSWRAAAADPVAVGLTLFMGLQSVGYYALLSWLPALFESHGLSAIQGGLLLSVQGLVGMPFGLLLPALVHRLRDARPLVAAVSGLTLVGLLGLALAPMLSPLLWVVVVGVGQGATFPLALTLIGLRSRGGEATALLSTFVQSGGYVLATVGPLALALLRQWSGGWAVPFGALAALTLVQTAAGVGAARRRYAFGAELGDAAAL